ncbi:MAG: DUF1826 domain-containing protein [Betaproteobacteria bacterium]|nr:DUF1826 domain-containing protein [Betaproteobacteria bacterium]
MSPPVGMSHDPANVVAPVAKVFPFDITPPGDHAVVVRELHEAQAIHRFGVNLTVVRRTVSATRAAAVQALCASHDISIDVTMDTHPLYYDQQVAEVLPPELGTALGDDIASLVYWFVVLGQTPVIRLQLNKIAPVPDPAFATENQSLRLAVTYSGFGLQWVPNQAVQRVGPTAAKARTPDDHQTVVTAPASVRPLQPWWVAFIKGNDFPGNCGNGLVYRPSPQRTLSERRLQLTLDPIY